MDKDNGTVSLLSLLEKKYYSTVHLKLFQGFISAAQKFKHSSISTIYYFHTALIDWREAASFLALANQISVRRKYQGGESQTAVLPLGREGCVQ